ncbi:MAG: GldG family protein [Elainellaceae cyanobacterium]
MRNITFNSSALKALKYLFWLGPILIIMGLTAGIVAGSWGTLPLALLLSGLLLLLLWLLAESNSLPGFFGRRSTQAGTNALVSTIAVIVILGLLNFLAVRYVQRIDLTENQLFTLSPQTQEILNNLDQPVKAWVFWDEQTPPNPAVRDLLENYQRQTDQFTYEFVDPQSQPGLAEQFEVESFGEVHLEAGDRQLLLQNLNPQQAPAGPQQALSERQLTSSIVQLLSDRQPSVYLLQGHGERSLEPGQGGISEAVQLLETENYAVEPLNLAQTAAVPDDASVVVIPGPTRELLEGEVSALESYLEAGGGLLVLADPNTDPGLEELLSDWGVSLSDRLIIDPSGQAVGLGLTTAVVQSYGDHPITQDLGNGLSFYLEAQPILLEENVPEGVETAPLLITNEQAQGLEIPESGELEFNPERDLPGPLVFGVALSQPVAAGASPGADIEAEADSAEEEARLVVIGNSSFIVNGLVSQQLNGDIFLNAVNWLSQEEQQNLGIRPKEATNRRIILQPTQSVLIALTAVAILPLIGFGGAIALWLKRR